MGRCLGRVAADRGQCRQQCHSQPCRGRDVGLRAACARALYLSLHDHPQDAEAVLPALIGASPDLRSEYHYAVGNSRMRMGFARIEQHRIDEATALINLAKASYRDALRAWPGNYDAKVNLDLAMPLVRDMPRHAQDGDEDTDAQPRRLWTDLRGLRCIDGDTVRPRPAHGVGRRQHGVQGFEPCAEPGAGVERGADLCHRWARGTAAALIRT